MAGNFVALLGHICWTTHSGSQGLTVMMGMIDSWSHSHPKSTNKKKHENNGGIKKKFVQLHRKQRKKKLRINLTRTNTEFEIKKTFF